MSDIPNHRGLRLLDLIALVAAYSLAALLIRAFWPHEGMPTPIAGAFVGLTYAWLGLAMTGPLVLLLDQRARLSDPGSGPESRPPYTWAETAWLLVGGYWIGLAMFVVPSRLPVNPMIGVLPVFVAIVIRVSGPRKPPAVRSTWTHAVAVIVLSTWPFAWIAMIILSKTLI
jgi:hypothetical protein